MESSVGNSRATKENSRATKEKGQSSGVARKYWTRAEEDALICAVKELILDGWKAGNGWRPGFYKEAAKLIRVAIPTSDVLGEPHVNSKLTVWKRDHNALSALFGASGGGLDPFDHTITIVGSQEWETSVKLNPDLDRMKTKSYPLYDQWKEIFGKDRANGSAAHDLGSTVQQIAQQRNLPIPRPATNPMHPPPPGQTYEEVEDSSIGAGDQAESANSRKRKRKSKASIDEEPIAKMMGSFMTDTKDAIVDLSKAISSLKEVDPAVSKVFEELENIPVFTMDERAVAASKIVASPTALALFFSMRPEGRISFIRGILRGNI